jgi:hypothetical protein
MILKGSDTMAKPATKVLYLEGTASWPRLNSPAVNFNRDGKEYRTDLIVTTGDAQPTIEALNKLIEDALPGFLDEQLQTVREKLIKEGKKPLADKYNADRIKTEFFPEQMTFFKEDTDEEGEPNGKIIFKFKRPATWKDKEGKEHKAEVRIYDAAGTKLDEPPLVRAGSRIVVAFGATPFAKAGLKTYGVSLRLRSVQIIDLARGEDGVAFAKRDDGYVYNASDAFKADKPPAGATAGGEDDDGNADF